MEKIWIKKELYILNYEFLSLFPIFIWFLIEFLNILLVKIAKKGEKLPAADVASGPRRSWRGDWAKATGWRGARVHRAVTTWRWGHEAGRVWPTRGVGGADAWQEATRTVPVRGATWQAGQWRTHGLVGPGKYFGVVTQ